MANHFPTVPSFSLVQLDYCAILPYPQFSSDTPVYNTVVSTYCGSDATGYTVGHGNILAAPNGNVIFSPDGEEDNSILINISIAFDTPGSAGDFDQDTTEASISSTLNSIVDAISSITGSSTSTVAPWIQVQRLWQYRDSSGQWNTSYLDTMTYTY